MREVRTPGDPKPADAEADSDAPEQASIPKRFKRQAEQAPAEQAGGLPNAIDIDPKAITAPVLTNQGWVCPDEEGRKPKDAHKP